MDLDETVYNAVVQVPNGLENELLMSTLAMYPPESIVNSINRLLQTGQLEMMQTGRDLRYRAVTSGEQQRLATLSIDERLVYKHIENSKNEGIWVRILKQKTNLAQNVINRSLKGLEQKAMIKSIKSVKHPTRKLYMLIDMVPSSEITGGPWYTDQEMDTDFIDTLGQQCYKFVYAHSFPRGSTAIYSANHTGFPTASQIRRYIGENRITNVDLSVENIEELLSMLVYDGKIERIMPTIDIGGSRGKVDWMYLVTKVASVDAWTPVTPVQTLFPKTTLDTIIAFIPEKSSAPAITSAQAATLAHSIFAPTGYGMSGRFNAYSSGAIKMTGLVGSGDPYVTVKYISEGVNSCDRGVISNAVYAAIAPANPARLIIVQNTRNPTCTGMADNTGAVTMVWDLDALNPHVLFHELGHSLSFPHPATSVCYSGGKQVTASANCTSIDGDDYQNMGIIKHDAPWYEADGVTNVATDVKGIMEYSSYNRFSSPWPMLKEENIIDVTTTGVYILYNSETAGIGTKPTILRIPLNPPVKVSNDVVSTGVTYHTHYYVDFSPRHVNTVAGGTKRYIVVRTAPDHRAKRSRKTRFVEAISKVDSNLSTTFYDDYRELGITVLSSYAENATVVAGLTEGYGPASNVNQCYYSGVIDSSSAVTVNGKNVCRGLSRNNLPSTGSFNGTHCLIPYSGVGHIVAAPDLEYLHCQNTPKWKTTAQSTMENGFDFFDESDMFVCKITYESVLYQGRGHFGECCFYYNGSEKCITNDASTLYLSWIS
ncbi:34-kDa subunit of RNA polymerase III (C) [Coemansia erecta]|uniref:34-kDa subunit of RNA polymerase III (C) n=1 Tax=Coemansia erecta TaxID=147472 RepID=A0A9W7Y5V0_9FUNG|nr:34-kDa subunit of RNA polymerase III (C) [Coemansia erecta]